VVLYFARHGESEANLLRVVSNRGLTHELTDRGREQAATLAAALKGLGISRAHSSPLLRAMETAAVVARELGLACEASDALREYDCGAWEGRSDAETWASHRKVFLDWMARRHWDRKAGGGESFLQIRDRFVPFVEGLRARHWDSRTRILLIGHGGVFRLMLPLVAANIDFEFALGHDMPNTGVIAIEQRDGRLICSDWCGLRVEA